jgi:bifunctional N-acetylglucosamine-1-phosphate-uridyltransferase/glucosamine-1-phosphate-acetyltransferase GlmU-like protein
MSAGVTLLDPASAYIGPELGIGNDTTIGDRCMVRRDTQLVAPVTVGDDVYAASGTSILRDVSDGALAISVQPGFSRCGWTEGWHQRHANHPKARGKATNGNY